MQASSSTPSVFFPKQEYTSQPPMDAFGNSSAAERSDSPNRRQRISMACQYCRHRKIRCCGGAPCRNCARSQRECEYAPVPEEVNRATREKKAVAKATRVPFYPSPTATYSPYFVESPVFELPYIQPAPRPPMHRRSISVPNFDSLPWAPAPPPAPMLQSPATFEPSNWMYSGWNAPPPIPSTGPMPSTAQFPSVLEPVHPHYHAQSSLPPMTPPDSRSGSSDSDVAWTTPSLHHLRVPVLTPAASRTPYSPVSPAYCSPHPTPPLYQHQQMYPSPLGYQLQHTSPTLAQEHPHGKGLVGLGIHENTSYLAGSYVTY